MPPRICLLLTTLLFASVQSARILGAVFTPSYSHQLVFQPIWRELSLRGHQVTVLTTNPMNDPTLKNLSEIDLGMSYDIMRKHNAEELLSTTNESLPVRYQKYMMALHEVAEAQLAHEKVQHLLKHKKDEFDLLMVEVIYPTQMAFSWWFGVPFIGLVSLDAPTRVHEAIGNPSHPVLYPAYDLPFSQASSFSERVFSIFFYFVMMWVGECRLHPREEATLQKYFGDGVPSLNDIQRNMSLLFLNINPVFHNVRPLLPNTITIGGGLHLDNNNKALPKDILDFLDGSPEGFVYFSLGTNVKSSALANSTKTIIVEALTEIPYKVLWKFEDTTIGNLPKNVKVVQWVDQRAVLAHPNIKVFITQCGLQSMEEAILSGVPMIGLPFYGDQRQNSQVLEKRDIGIKLYHQELNKSEFVKSILDVASNPVFKENLQKTASLLKDDVVSGLEKAVWWTEYLLRHKDVQHLKSHAVDVPLYQYFFLDIIAFFSVILLVLVFLLFLATKILKFVIKSMFKRLFGGNKKKSE